MTDSESVFYITLPPTSGDHWERWADCGFYDSGLPDELIVHNLEHGNIVVSYSPDTPLNPEFVFILEFQTGGGFNFTIGNDLSHLPGQTQEARNLRDRGILSQTLEGETLRICLPRGSKARCRP